MIVECPGCKSRYDVTGRPAGTRARCRCGTVFELPAPPEWAGGLNCPNCAAVCAPDQDRCAYCRAVLAVIACPRCFGKAFLGAKHCTHCGAGLGEAARTMEGAASRKCPRCPPSDAGEAGVPLVAQLVGETLLDTCACCGGVWVDLMAFEKVVQDRTRQSALLAIGIMPAVSHVATAGKEQVAYLRCPDCWGVMSRRNFGKRSGVVVDVCKSHGTWFDKDELRAVIEFVMNGGLGASHEKDLEEIRREVREKELKIRQLGASGGSGASGSMGASDLSGTWWKVSILSEVLKLLFRAVAR